MSTTHRPWWILAALAVAVLWSACQVYPADERSSYDLEGAHRDLACMDCHTDDSFRDAPPTRCSACHTDDRPALHWGEDDCGECHTQERWDDVEFDHDDWPLTGAHRETPCAECHTGSDFEDVAGDSCKDCHTPPPFHSDEDCDECHNTWTWDD